MKPAQSVFIGVNWMKTSVSKVFYMKMPNRPIFSESFLLIQKSMFQHLHENTDSTPLCFAII